MIAIHIGAPKAGSTTIQKFLGGNTDELRQLGVDYPTIGRTNRGHHVNLYYDLRGHRNFKEKYGNVAQLVERLKTDRARLSVLSAEEFHRLTPEEVSNFGKSLIQVDKDIQIILIIRDLVDLMPSSYSQATKGGESLVDFDAFHNARVRRQGRAPIDMAQAWGTAFGWDQLRVRVLDRRLLVNGDLIDDFLTVLGIDPNGSDFQRSDTTSVANASLGWRVLEAVRALYCGSHGLPATHPLSQALTHDQHQRKFIGRVARQLGEEIGWNVDRGRYMSRAQAEQCTKIHRETIAALNEVLPQSLPQPLDLEARGFVEREFMPEASQIPVEELHGFYDELASRASRKRPTPFRPG